MFNLLIEMCQSPELSLILGLNNKFHDICYGIQMKFSLINIPSSLIIIIIFFDFHVPSTFQSSYQTGGVQIKSKRMDKWRGFYFHRIRGSATKLASTKVAFRVPVRRIRDRGLVGCWMETANQPRELLSPRYRPLEDRTRYIMVKPEYRPTTSSGRRGHSPS